MVSAGCGWPVMSRYFCSIWPSTPYAFAASPPRRLPGSARCTRLAADWYTSGPPPSSVAQPWMPPTSASPRPAGADNMPPPRLPLGERWPASPSTEPSICWALLTRFCRMPAPVCAPCWMPCSTAPPVWATCCCWLAWALIMAAWAVIDWVAEVISFWAASSDISPLATLMPSCWINCFWASLILSRFGLSVNTGLPSSPIVTMCGAVVSGVSAWPACGLGGGFQSGPLETSFELPCASISRTFGERASFCATVYVVSVGSGLPCSSLASCQTMLPSGPSMAMYVLPLRTTGCRSLARRLVDGSVPGTTWYASSPLFDGSYSTRPLPGTLMVLLSLTDSGLPSGPVTTVAVPSGLTRYGVLLMVVSEPEGSFGISMTVPVFGSRRLTGLVVVSSAAMTLPFASSLSSCALGVGVVLTDSGAALLGRSGTGFSLPSAGSLP